jgi:hypothetical protein
MLEAVGRRVRPGDVYEYDLGGSFAYLQYVERRQPLGPLVRVLELRTELRPAPEVVAAAVNARARFLVFVDVAGGVRSGALEYVTTCDVPPLAAEDRWRSPARRDEENRATSWWIQDGAGGEKRHVRELQPDDRSCYAVHSSPHGRPRAMPGARSTVLCRMTNQRPPRVGRTSRSPSMRSSSARDPTLNAFVTPPLN